MDSNEKQEIHIHLHVGSGLAETQYHHLLDAVQNLDSKISTVESEIMTKLDDNFTQLVQDVTDEETVGQSALTLLQGLVDAAKNATTPQQVADLSAKIQAFKQKFADAITANTAAAGGGGTGTGGGAKLTAVPTSLAVAVGGSQQIGLSDASGVAAVGVTAQSSDATIATAAADGTITGVKAGTATVTFTDSKSATVAVSVTVS